MALTKNAAVWAYFLHCCAFFLYIGMVFLLGLLPQGQDFPISQASGTTSSQARVFLVKPIEVNFPFYHRGIDSGYVYSFMSSEPYVRKYVFNHVKFHSSFRVSDPLLKVASTHNPEIGNGLSFSSNHLCEHVYESGIYAYRF